MPTRQNRWLVMTVLISLFIVFSSITPTFAQEPVGNLVDVALVHGNWYSTEKDSVNNVPLEWSHEWFTNIGNTPDGGPPVVNPRVELYTNSNLVRFRPNDPTVFTANPPYYLWNFANLEIGEQENLPLSAWEAQETLIARPRFSASRSVEPEILTQEVTLQTVTVTFRLEESLPPNLTYLGINIARPTIVWENVSLVQTSIVSQVPIEGWETKNDGVQAMWYTYDPSTTEVGKTYEFKATLRCVKSSNLLSSLLFKPTVQIGYNRWQTLPMVTGKSITITDPNDNMSATFRADNVVDWRPGFSDTTFNFEFYPVVSQITTLPPYDDFSGTYIDRKKWALGEFVREIREIEPGNYKLILKQASPNPHVIRIMGASYPYYETNGLIFIDPTSVNSIKADVTILENSITNSGFTSAGCAGNWYSDGTPGEGRIGDIQAAVVLEGRPSGLFATWNIFKMTNSEGTTWTVLGRGDFATPITNGTPYTLYIEYDSVNNRFIFRVGGEQIEFSTGLPPWAGNAKIPFKSLATRVRIDNENSSAFISATFDNIYKNGSPYDNFSSSTIDATKWGTYEFVREISNGKLRTKVRTSSASNNEVENMLPSLIPIKAAQAKVTLLDYQNPPGPDFRVGVGVRFEGAFYNDGTQGEGQSGDVNANVRIMANELSTLVPVWEVSRCPDSECDNEETLAEGVFTTPIVLGNTYTLFIQWDGSQFTLKFNDEVANYTPTSSSVNAARLPYINLMTELNATPGHNKEATIEALFDDVEVNETTPSQYTLTISKSGTGNGTVTSSPAGINCGDDCTEDFKVGTKITLKAKADTNSTFTGWSGGGCSGTGTCAVIMNADIAVTAGFAAKTPDISVAQTSLDFGSVKVGKKITKTLKIVNNGSGDLLITLSGLEETDFSIQGSSSVTIKAKKTYSLKVLCTPTSGGLKTATLEIDSNDPDTPTLEISLTGTLPATTPDISVAQAPIDFGNIKVGKKVTKTLKITNNGTGDLMITLSGLEETDFSIQGSSSVTIKGKKSYSLKVLFTPTSAALKTATLEITSNDPDTPTIDISLSGTGQ